MRCFVVNCVYPPEPVVSAHTSAQVAEALALAGHKVTVVTSFPSRPEGRLYPGYRRRLLKRESSASGFKLVRCFSCLSSESRIISRLLENLSFGMTSGWQVLSIRKPDVIYANTWPIVAIGILCVVTKLRRIPLVISVQDMYAESLIAQRRIKENDALARTLRWIDGVISRNCAHVIVISERFREIYLAQRRVQVERLSLVPNWIDGNQVDIRVSGREYRHRLGIGDDDFLLVYGGNIGVASGVQTVIQAVAFLEDLANVRLLIAGLGSQLAACICCVRWPAGGFAKESTDGYQKKKPSVRSERCICYDIGVCSYPHIRFDNLLERSGGGHGQKENTPLPEYLGLAWTSDDEARRDQRYTPSNSPK